MRRIYTFAAPSGLALAILVEVAHDLLARLDAIFHRHVDVQDNNAEVVGCLCKHCLDGLLPVCDADNLVKLVLELHVEQAEQERLVIRNEASSFASWLLCLILDLLPTGQRIFFRLFLVSLLHLVVRIVGVVLIFL